MADQETTTINLRHDVTVNGVTYKKGDKVVVPAKQAEDITRIDSEHQDYKDGLHKKRTYESNAGSISVGSGAE